MFGADKGKVDDTDGRMDGKQLRIAIVQARFNASVTDALADACKQELLALGVAERDIHHFTVPGALEVATALQALAEKTRYDALVALGCIIRGETYHFELVANESGAAVTRVGLDYQIPIANAILTVENMAQAEARQVDKGRDAARVAVEMANFLETI
jgi:6,7-dimethyl-8-ribityllumazine synthase